MIANHIYGYANRNVDLSLNFGAFSFCNTMWGYANRNVDIVGRIHVPKFLLLIIITNLKKETEVS